MKIGNWKKTLLVSLLIILALHPFITSVPAGDDAAIMDEATTEPLIPSPFYYDKKISEAPSAVYDSTKDLVRLDALSDFSLQWSQVNLDGFDPVFNPRGLNNYGVFDDSLVEFNGLLFAGTDNPNYGPEIWFYNGDGSTTWTKVSDMPSGFSFLYGGEATQFLIEFKGYLYTGTVYGANAPVKENGQLWRTNAPVNGNSWMKVFDYDDWLINPQAGAFGDVLSAVEFNGYLYVSARATLSGKTPPHAEIFRSPDGLIWEKIIDDGFGDMHNLWAYPFAVFNGELYVALRNNADGVEIWRTNNGLDWEQANINGMADDMYQTHRDMIRQLMVYNGYLYATIRNDFNTAIQDCWLEVWRSQNGTDWAQIGGNGLGDPANNVEGRGIEVYNNCLYIGTGENYTSQARIYRTCDGVSFSEVTGGQLGDSKNHNVVALKTYDQCLYAATYRYASGVGGTEVWRYCDADADGIEDAADNCPQTPNGPDKGTCLPGSDKAGAVCYSNADCVIGCSSNGICDLSQQDTDADGVGDVCDNCPAHCNMYQLDADKDGIGDVCDTTPSCGGCAQPICEQQC